MFYVGYNLVSLKVHNNLRNPSLDNLMGDPHGPSLPKSNGISKHKLFIQCYVNSLS